MGSPGELWQAEKRDEMQVDEGATKLNDEDTSGAADDRTWSSRPLVGGETSMVRNTLK